MKNFSLKLTASLILHTELLCLVGLIQFTDGHIPVRLVNPNSSLSSPHAGRLEVRWHYTSTGGWGTVCDDYFNDDAARVACYSLGFGRAGSFVRNRYGSGSGEIWLSGVSCNGREADINSCSHRGWESHKCRYYNDVSIECDVKDCIGDESKCDLVSTACIIINGSNTCSCRKGFASLYETTCVDLDECAYPPSGCTTAAGTCVNTIGSYTCSCKDGYTQTTSTVCSDIDECRHGPSECNTTTGRCINTVGSYRCSCRSGYGNTIRSTMCTDIDECSTGQFRCDSTSTTCVNTVGSYTCSCRDGYTQTTSTVCSDIDECRDGPSECNTTAGHCINIVGSYRCSCRSGYGNTLRPTMCTDIDECSTGQSRCDSASTTCVNTDGGYQCPCRNGYKNNSSDSRSCRDINECTNGQSQCDASTTTCVNTPGGYNCSCKKGFRYSTFSSCTDLDECVSNESECDLKSTNCINTVGNYTCLCKNGFTYLNETTCLVGLIEESSQERFGLGAIVGTCVGAFLVVAAVAILILLFCWKRRNEVNQPPQRQSSEVDNGPGVENYCGNPIVYMELDQTALGMGRKTTKNAQIEASTRLPVPTEETKATAQSPVFGNVQSSIYATVVSSVDVNAQSAIYENVQE